MKRINQFSPTHLLPLTISGCCTARLPVHKHSVAVAQCQLLLLAVGLPEDGQVREDHDGAGDPEGDGTGDDHVHLVNYELASVRIGHRLHPMLGRRVPPVEDWHKGQEGRRCPRD